MKTKLFENIDGNRFRLSEDGEMSDYDRSRSEAGEEDKEVRIGQTIIDICDGIQGQIRDPEMVLYALKRIKIQALELKKMHGKQ